MRALRDPRREALFDVLAAIMKQLARRGETIRDVFWELGWRRAGADGTWLRIACEAKMRPTRVEHQQLVLGIISGLSEHFSGPPGLARTCCEQLLRLLSGQVEPEDRVSTS